MQRFSEWAYSHEQEILQQLPRLDIRQQVELDVSLNSHGASGPLSQHANDFAHDNAWKRKVPEIIEGRETDREIISKTIEIIKRDIQTHQRTGNEVTGSVEWHKAWIDVYNHWLTLLLGALHGEKGTGTQGDEKGRPRRVQGYEAG